VVRGWRAFGLPMPRVLAPIGDAFEHADDGRFHFHVELKHPLAGLIVRYQGWLEPAAALAVHAAVETEQSGAASDAKAGEAAA
jgi:hypothetical protein